jgi:hypothetical protein
MSPIASSMFSIILISSDFRTTRSIVFTLVGEPARPQLSGSALIALMSHRAIWFSALRSLPDVMYYSSNPLLLISVVAFL